MSAPTTLPAVLKQDQLPTQQKTSMDYAALARATSTSRNYTHTMKAFVAWCRATGKSPMPAVPETVADYLTDKANAGSKVATMSLHLSAILASHRLSGHPIDARSGILAATWSGIRRNKVAPQRQAMPLSRQDLKEALGLIGTDAKGLRDRAILAFGLMSGRRRSELTGLDLGRLGSGTGFVTIDERGIEIVLVRSKASQDAVQTFAVPRSVAPVAVATLETWLKAASVQEGEPLFRGVNNSGIISMERLSDEGLVRSVRSSMRKLAFSRGMTREEIESFADTYSGHSLRVGFAVAAIEDGAAHEHVADHLGHGSTGMVRRYAKQADRWKGQAFGKGGV
jgi:site-specific recombinase XerD